MFIAVTLKHSGANPIEGTDDLTIGPDMTIRGLTGFITSGNSITNEGSILSNALGIITIGQGGETFINNGTVAASERGGIKIESNWTNNASISIDGGVSLELRGTFNNLGTIAMTDSLVRFGGPMFTVAEIGDFTRSGGNVDITGQTPI